MRIRWSFGLVFSVLMGCSGAEVTSDWRGTRVMEIDGQYGDWVGGLDHNDDLDIDFGVMNDDEYLYIALAPLDPDRQRQIMMGGLTFWFDPTDKGTKTNGLRFPVGVGKEVQERIRQGGSLSQGELERMFRRKLDIVALVNTEGEKGRLLSPDQVEGLEVAARSHARGFYLELRIPLRATSGLQLGLSAGESVVVGLETASMPRPSRGGAPERGRGGAAGRPGGSRRGGQRGSRLDPLDDWVKVNLSRAEDFEQVATSEQANKENH